MEQKTKKQKQEMKQETEVQVVKIEKETRLEKVGNIQAVKEQVQNIMNLYKDVMKEGIDYGVVPGTQKPSLLKPGAEKISFMFRLVPEFEINEKWLENGHLTVLCKCELWTQSKDGKLGEGVGMCSTLESKYKYRNAERVCPDCGKNTIIKGKEEFGGGWICYSKKGGCGAKFDDNDQQIVSQAVGKIENENIADTYNTILKMAKKRAYIDAVLTVSGVSDIFTQDVEEFVENENVIKKTENKIKNTTVKNGNLVEKLRKLLNEWYSLEVKTSGIKGSPEEFLEFVFSKCSTFDLTSKNKIEQLTTQEMKELIKICEFEIKNLQENKGKQRR